jgi:hypothetical protein
MTRRNPEVMRFAAALRIPSFEKMELELAMTTPS